MCGYKCNYDLSTANNKVYETYSTINDKNFSTNEIFRFIQTYDPKECVIIYKNLEKFTKNPQQFLNNYLDLSYRVTHYYDLDNICAINNHIKNYLNLNYQKNLLEKVFNNKGITINT